MKALILSNCSWKAYYNYLHGLRPDWDIRAAALDQAANWIETGHEGFLAFTAEADLAIGLLNGAPTAQKVASLLPATARCITLPAFQHSGYQPDTMWLHGITSPMQLGVIHSRIVVAAFLAGRSQAETRALFTGAHYDRLGYYDMLAISRSRETERFAAAGLEIAGLFEGWAAAGNFMHTPNHPVTSVFFDIAHLGMMGAGLTDDLDPAMVAALRANFPDYLGASVLWPVYPEIAEHHGIAATPEHWREPLVPGLGQSFDLDEMIARSWTALAAASPTDVARVRSDYPGGEAAIALAAGD